MSDTHAPHRPPVRCGIRPFRPLGVSRRPRTAALILVALVVLSSPTSLLPWVAGPSRAASGTPYHAPSPTGSSGVAAATTCASVPSVKISATPVNGTAPVFVTLTSNVTGGCRPYYTFWQFGDGTSRWGANVTHTYWSAGTFYVHVWVRDSANQSAQAQTVVRVVGGSGGLSIAVQASPGSGPAPLSVTCWANITGGNSSSGFVTYWNFGDGGYGRGAVVPHVFQTTGVYKVVATVWQGYYPRANASFQVTVLPAVTLPPANLSLSVVPAITVPPSDVTITAYSNGFGSPLGLTVCYGDGSNCSATLTHWNGTAPAVFIHRYDTAGNFSIVGTLLNSQGQAIFEATTLVVVAVVPTLVLEVASSPESGRAPLTATFEITVRGGLPPYAVQWDFGDGTLGSSIPGASASHTYGGSGTFLASVQVRDSGGHSVRSTLHPIRVSSVTTSGLPATIFGAPTVALITVLLLAASGLGVVAGRWSMRRPRVERLREEGEELVRELEGRP